MASDAPPLTLRVCDGLPCELAGARELLARLPAVAGPGVRVVAASCLGRCDRAPAALLGEHAIAPASADAVATAVHVEATRAEPSPFVTLAQYRAEGGYRLLAACAAGERDAEGVIDTLEAAGLRGLGGAGVPAARKWRAVRAQPAPRCLAVNANEGEPGTFKVRALLERDPHRVLEGMLVAAWAVGIERIHVHLRDAQAGCHARLAEEIERLRAAAIAPLPEIALHRAPDAYVAGEASAMLASIEGRAARPGPHAGEPPALFGRPALVHSAETLAWVREILERGAAWFAAQGRRGRSGLRWYCVSGRVREPGVKRAPAGLTIQELIDQHCGGMQPGHRFYAWLPGGAAGGILPATMNRIPLDFDTLEPYGCAIGPAGVIVLSDHDSAVGAARSLARFFARESCGQCTACRDGTAEASALVAADEWDLGRLKALAAATRAGSICGLGQAAPTPVECVVRYFPHELMP